MVMVMVIGSGSEYENVVAEGYEGWWFDGSENLAKEHEKIACDIKDPKQNIEWTVPEGGGGPGYSIMVVPPPTAVKVGAAFRTSIMKKLAGGRTQSDDKRSKETAVTPVAVQYACKIPLHANKETADQDRDMVYKIQKEKKMQEAVRKRKEENKNPKIMKSMSSTGFEFRPRMSITSWQNGAPDRHVNVQLCSDPHKQ
ncbi:hypothetical protein RJ639_002940 [Escallonia herrerae]|uniref:ETF-QO/FixX C-terminal domain-containing protein n=1 Tax=Escallonia herrerae TaxID=1293975 RepID=A0AA89B2T2_9ASTE|nr:hypothetical protein RJ639_002940 [Escallonia herrerae]